MEIALPLMVIVLAALMFFSGSRQRRALKEVQRVQESLQPGDRVMTTSGLHGTVVAKGESTVELEVAPGVHTTWDLRVIREKVEPATGTEPTGADPTGTEPGEPGRPRD